MGVLCLTVMVGLACATSAEAHGVASATLSAGDGPLGVLASLQGSGSPDRTLWVQGPLAILILLSPIACLVLFILSLLERFPEEARLRLAIATFAVPPLALFIYLVYESGVSDVSNIRIDLLILYPALSLAFLFWPALLIRFAYYRWR